MLVLTRGVGEGLMIGDDIVVTVERIAGGVVRIGIKAPKDAAIMRQEILLPPPASDVVAEPSRNPHTNPKR